MWKRATIGLLIALLIALTIFFAASNRSAEKTPVSLVYPTDTPKPRPALVLLSKRVKEYNDHMFGIIGEVQNAGNEPINDIIVTAIFFDKDGQILDSGPAMLQPSPIQPRETATFEAVVSDALGFAHYRIEMSTPSRESVPYIDKSKN